MEAIGQRPLVFVFAALALLGDSAFTQDTTFRRAQLAYGISLDVPSHWVVLAQDVRKNLRAAGQAVTDNAGLRGSGGQKETLLAMNAPPDPTGAMIRVSVTSPPEFTQEDLAATTTKDLEVLGKQLLEVFRKAEASGGARIIDMQPARIERFDKRQALVMSYVRAGGGGSSPWRVTQYKIPVPNRLIELTLSHRQSDAGLWQPILERVRRSVEF